VATFCSAKERGLGPTLGQPLFNVPDALPDPFLDVRDANGNMIMTNNNWEAHPMPPPSVAAVMLRPIASKQPS
jgi:hypothetical protein